MIRLITHLVAAYVFMSLLSCNSLAKKQENLWLFTHYSGDKKPGKAVLTPVSFINLQQDGMYTRDFESFDYGKWLKQRDTLLLISAKNDTIVYPLKFENNEALQVFSEQDVIANFASQPFTPNAPAKDPFSLVNNRWRIPPTHKETELQIKERLQYHCQFWITYFTWANDHQIETVDVRGTPSPITIYNNGFTLKSYNELPKKWHSYFYDSEDCRRANNMIYEVMQFHQITLPQTENKYTMFISAFQQLQGYLNDVVSTR